MFSLKYKVYYQENDKLLNISLNNLDHLKDIHNIVYIRKNKSLEEYMPSFVNYQDKIADIFKELSIILNTNLNLSQAIDILIKANKDKVIGIILTTINNALRNGQQIDIALIPYVKITGKLPLLFFRLGATTGDIKQSINALSVILLRHKQTKKQLLNALSYPIVLGIALLGATWFIFSFVVPNFEHIFSQFGSNLPFATKCLLAVKNFFDNHFDLIIVAILITLFLVKYLYKRFTSSFDKFFMLHIPVIGILYKNFVLYRLFLALSMLINSKHKFQVALYNIKELSNNYYIHTKLTHIISDLKNGSSIHIAFDNTKLFDNVVIRLLYTAEQTNTMPHILTEITNIYKINFDKSMSRLSDVITPIFVLILSFFILWLVFALMLPIWDLGSVLN